MDRVGAWRTDEGQMNLEKIINFLEMIFTHVNIALDFDNRLGGKNEKEVGTVRIVLSATVPATTHISSPALELDPNIIVHLTAIKAVIMSTGSVFRKFQVISNNVLGCVKSTSKVNGILNIRLVNDYNIITWSISLVYLTLPRSRESKSDGVSRISTVCIELVPALAETGI
uniref:Uncharacterized protein n=1 Tax=Rhodnius prolixus TaxID=13249 RepID=T1HJ47_RHOPR